MTTESAPEFGTKADSRAAHQNGIQAPYNTRTIQFNAVFLALNTDKPFCNSSPEDMRNSTLPTDTVKETPEQL